MDKQIVKIVLALFAILVFSGQIAFASGRHEIKIEPTEYYHVKLIKNISFSSFHDGNQQSLYMDILRPTSDAPLPCIVYITGNAWRYADRSVNLPMFAQIARSGYVIAFIDWRAITNSTFPAQIEDAKTAVRFLRANASKYNVDPDNIGAWGHSSGGYLAAMLGTAGDVKEFEGGDWQGYSSRVKAVAVWEGPVELSSINPDPLYKSYESMLLDLDVHDPANSEKVMAANPASYITADAPPFLLMYGEKDSMVPINQGEDFYEELAKGGVDATFYKVAGGEHSSAQFTNQEKIMGITKGFFDTYLKKGNAETSSKAEG